MPVDPKYISKEYTPMTYEIGREKMREYARATGNDDPLYLDNEVGKNSKYGDCIAPPMFAVVYCLQVLSKALFDPELKLNLIMLVHGEQEFEWYQVAKPGDVMTSKGRISNIYSKKNLDFVEVESKTTNQKGEEVCKGVATFVIRNL